MKGFTLIEILIVITIMAFLVALTIPLGIQFYKNQQFDTIVDEVIQALRRAQWQAMSAKNDSSFGVYFKAGQYILFQGVSYIARNDEEIFDFSNDISFSGISEVIFSKIEGIPSSVGDITLTGSYETAIISINQVGRVNYEE